MPCHRPATSLLFIEKKARLSLHGGYCHFPSSSPFIAGYAFFHATPPPRFSSFFITYIFLPILTISIAACSVPPSFRRVEMLIFFFFCLSPHNGVHFLLLRQPECQQHEALRDMKIICDALTITLPARGRNGFLFRRNREEY